MDEMDGSFCTVVPEWPTPQLDALKTYNVTRTYAVHPGDIDPALQGKQVGRLVPLLMLWLQQLETRVGSLEQELQEKRATRWGGWW